MNLTFDEQPVVDDGLNVGVEEAGDVMTHLQVRDVDERTRGRTEGLLTQDPHDQFSVLHDHLIQQTNVPVNKKKKKKKN